MLRTSLLRSLTRWRRRLSVAALLVLHAMISGAELFEPVSEVRLDTHAEEHGNRHPFAHDATSCAVCSVQLQHADVPTRPTISIAEEIIPVATVTHALRTGSAARFRVTSTRAPPTSA